jgi:CTP:phosphocholine cytidylyltransferase-like protein
MSRDGISFEENICNSIPLTEFFFFLKRNFHVSLISNGSIIKSHSIHSFIRIRGFENKSYALVVAMNQKIQSQIIQIFV